MAFVKLLLDNWFPALLIGGMLFAGIESIIRAVRNRNSNDEEE